MCVIATVSVEAQQTNSFAAFYCSTKVVWNIRLRDDVFCLLESAWIFSHYINEIAPTGVIGAKPRARRCSMLSRSERGARNSAIFWRQTAERHGMIPNLPGVLPLLPPPHVSGWLTMHFKRGHLNAMAISNSAPSNG